MLKVAHGHSEQIAAKPSTTHLTSLEYSLGYSWLELLDRSIFLNLPMPGWYSVEFNIATARGNDVIAYLNASVNFTTLWTSKPKAGKNSFTTDKGLKTFFLLVSTY